MSTDATGVQQTAPAPLIRMSAPDVAALAVLAVALVIRLAVPVDANIDWLLSTCRRFLDGAVLYRDIVETNPPMAIFIYLPAALVERFTGLRAEPVVTGLVLAGGAVACGWLARTIRAAEPACRHALPALLAAVLVAPLAAFAEREHVALILVLPIVGVAVGRGAGATPTLSAVLVAGTLAGIAAMIKPHFALAIAAPYLALACSTRRWQCLMAPEAVIAAGLVLAYAAAVPLVFPAYVEDVLPLLFDLYRPMRKPLPELLLTRPVLGWLVAVAALAMALRGRVFAPVPLVLLATSAGFLAGFVDQGRGWYYHAFPAISLLLAAALVVTPAAILGGEPVKRTAAIGAVLAALVQVNPSGIGYAGGGVVGPIRAAVAHPRVMSISFDLTPGHPVTTDVGGTWAGTYSSRWITVNARHLAPASAAAEVRARYDRWLAHDRAVTNRDLAGRPDIVLVGLGPFDWPGWIAADPETARLMAGYVPLARDELDAEARTRVEGVEAWIRRDLVRPARPAEAQ